jgi:hypothetical protein
MSQLMLLTVISSFNLYILKFSLDFILIFIKFLITLLIKQIFFFWVPNLVFGIYKEIKVKQKDIIKYMLI